MHDSRSGSSARHVSVLPAEVLQHLAPAPGETIVDATLGAGGHARVLAQHVLPAGRVIGVDQDATMLDLARQQLGTLPVTLAQANFSELPRVLNELGIERVDGLVADLGICSDQLDQPHRGFSFSQDGPLDMRMNQAEGESAADLLHRLPERDIADLIWQYGEERFSRRIARRIVQVRQKQALETTGQLAELVRQCVPRSRRRGRGPEIDPATRTFQALRIAVNDELGALKKLLSDLPRLLRVGGRAVLISFHSLEDRLVKQAFRHNPDWQELTRKPVTASEQEMATNPRSRSAKLRAARRLEPGSDDPKRATTRWSP